MSYSKIVVIGAGGDLGKPVLDQLVQSGKFDITVFARKSSSYTSPSPSVQVKKLDLHLHDALISALQGVDAIVLTLGDFANLETNTKPVVEAAIAAGVKRIIPSSFGNDLGNEPGSKQAVFGPKQKVEAYLAERAAAGEIEYTTIYNGPFFDWGLEKFEFLGFNIPERKVNIFDDGNAKINSTTLAGVGQAVVGVLSNPAATKNRAVRVHDYYISQNEIIAEVESLTGQKLSVSKTDTAKLEEDTLAGLGRGEFTEGNIYGYVQAVIFGKNSSASWGPNDDSELLGLEKKDLKDVIKKLL